MPVGRGCSVGRSAASSTTSTPLPLRCAAWPGILTAIGGFLDIGDLVTNAVVGSRFGLALAWVVVVGVVGICVFAQMAGRVAAVSGRATFEIIRERLGPRTAAANLSASFLINLMTLTAEIGDFALALQLATDVGRMVWIPLAAFGVRLVVWRVKFSVMENVTGLVGLCLIVFAVAVFALAPDWAAMGHAITHPVIPESESSTIYWYYAIALFGAGDRVLGGVLGDRAPVDLPPDPDRGQRPRIHGRARERAADQCAGVGISGDHRRRFAGRDSTDDRDGSRTVRILDARLHLLDRQLVDDDGDGDGDPMGIVDDLELDGVDIDREIAAGSHAPRVTGILSGQVLGTRIFGGAPPRSQLREIPWHKAIRIGITVTLAPTEVVSDVHWVEQWLRDHIIGHIPGDRHAAE